MDVKEAHTWVAGFLERVEQSLNLNTSEKVMIILDDRVAELEAENTLLLQQVSDREMWKADAEKAEAQRDALLHACRGIMGILTGRQIDKWPNNYRRAKKAMAFAGDAVDTLKKNPKE